MLLECPSTKLVDDRARLFVSRGSPFPDRVLLRVALECVRVVEAPLDLEQLADHSERFAAGLGVVRFGFDEVAPCMRPTMREPDVRSLFLDRFIRLVAVAQHGTLVAGEHLLRDLSAAARCDLVPARIMGGECPDPPSLAGVRAHEAPPRLVRADHICAEDVIAEREIARNQVHRDGVDDVPQRLRVDREALAFHDPDLALQRKVVQLLVDDDADGKREVVASPLRHLGHLRGSRDDRFGARAAIFLALLLAELVLAFDTNDDLAVFGLPVHGLERALTLRAGLLAFIENFEHLDDGQVGLRTRSVALLFATFLLLLGRRSPLRGISETMLLEAPDLLLETRELQRHLLAFAAPLEARDVPCKRLQ